MKPRSMPLLGRPRQGPLGGQVSRRGAAARECAEKPTTRPQSKPESSLHFLPPRHARGRSQSNRLGSKRSPSACVCDCINFACVGGCPQRTPHHHSLWRSSLMILFALLCCCSARAGACTASLQPVTGQRNARGASSDSIRPDGALAQQSIERALLAHRQQRRTSRSAWAPRTK